MSGRSASPFSRFGVLAILIVGFGAFAAMLYFIGVGDIGPEDGENGRAHSAASGLNGYSALVKLAEADGFETELSREQSGLETEDILVLTPPPDADPEELARLVYSRRDLGPTLIIVPKWSALPARFANNLEDPDAARRGWVLLNNTRVPRWIGTEYVPFAFEVKISDAASATDETGQSFATRGPIAGLEGHLPSELSWHVTKRNRHFPLIVDQSEKPLAVSYTDPTSQFMDAEPNWMIFVVEPDLVNNWGLADEDRAQAALSILNFMAADYSGRVVFDLTFNGFGGTLNLLTFAFRPPFLAATICLVLAILILAWRAFFRFGPAAMPARATAFGKAQLVANGADLIVRGNRLGLLGKPYAALSARRMAARLGVTSSDPQAIDAALEARKSEQPPFSKSAGTLANATKADTILSAAQALYHQSSREKRDTKGITDE